MTITVNADVPLTHAEVLAKVEGQIPAEFLQKTDLYVFMCSKNQVAMILSDDIPKTCFSCREQFPDRKLTMCGQCKCNRYCSKTCQSKHWKAVHKERCKPYDWGAAAAASVPPVKKL